MMDADSHEVLCDGNEKSRSHFQVKLFSICPLSYSFPYLYSKRGCRYELHFTVFVCGKAMIGLI